MRENTKQAELGFNVDDTMSFQGVGRGSNMLMTGTVVHVFEGNETAPICDPKAVEVMADYIDCCKFNPTVSGRQMGKRHYLVDVDGDLWRPTLTRIVLPDAPSEAQASEAAHHKQEVLEDVEALVEEALEAVSDVWEEV